MSTMESPLSVVLFFRCRLPWQRLHERQGRQQMKHWLRLTFLIVSLGMACGGGALRVAAAPTHPQQPAVRLACTPAYDGNYVPGTWLPLHITVSNDGPLIDARIAASHGDNNARYVVPLELPRGAQKTITLYVLIDQQTRVIPVTVEHSGETLARQEVEVRARARERLLGILSSSPFSLNLPRREDMTAWPFVAFSMSPSSFPEHAAGLNGLTILMLTDSTTAELTRAHYQAIMGWVFNGGHLVLAGGEAAPYMMDHVPLDLRAASAGEAGSVDLDTSFLGAFVGARAPATLPGQQLVPLPHSTPYGPPEAPLWVQRNLGEGQITQLAFDPARTTFRRWSSAPALWDRLLQVPFAVHRTFNSQTDPDALQENNLKDALLMLPSINLPPAAILFGLLILYSALIGPATIWFLRRIDRQAWGWWIVPALALAFFIGGGGLALLLRADQRVVSQVSLIEQISSNQARVRTLVGALAPQRQTFLLHRPAESLTRPLSSLQATYGTISGVAGEFVQQAGSMPMEVQRWEVQGVLIEQQIAFPELDARLVLEDDTIFVRVHNTTNHHLENVAVTYRGQVVQLADISPDRVVISAWPDAPKSFAISSGSLLSSLIVKAATESDEAGNTLLNRRVKRRELMVDAAMRQMGDTTEKHPLLFAWLNQNPLAVSLEAGGAAQQETTLLVAPVSIQGEGMVALPDGWMRAVIATNARCQPGQVAGIQTSSAPVTVTLRLPDDLDTLQTTALTLTLESSRTWPNSGVTTRLFNWQREEWVDIAYDGPGALRIPNPSSYVASGTLRLALGGRINEASCLFVRGQAHGKLP